VTVAVVEDPVGTVTEKSWPVPLKPRVCGLPGALSVNERLPDAAPPAEGVNVTATVRSVAPPLRSASFLAVMLQTVVV
jgi:hypothetical protein